MCSTLLPSPGLWACRGSRTWKCPCQRPSSLRRESLEELRGGGTSPFRETSPMGTRRTTRTRSAKPSILVSEDFPPTNEELPRRKNLGLEAVLQSILFRRLGTRTPLIRLQFPTISTHHCGEFAVGAAHMDSPGRVGRSVPPSTHVQ